MTEADELRTQEVLRQVESCRHPDTVRVGVFTSGATRQELDCDRHEWLNRFVKGLGYSGIDRNWSELSREDAANVLRLILQRDLAYGEPTCDEAQASWAVALWMEEFRDARCCTNIGSIRKGGTDEHDFVEIFSGITIGTFDAGVILVEANRAGFAWVMDED